MSASGTWIVPNRYRRESFTYFLPGKRIPTSYKSIATYTFHLVYLLRLFVAFCKSKVCTWKLRSHVFRNCVCVFEYIVFICRIGGEKFAGVWKIDAVAEVFGFLNWQLRFLCVWAANLGQLVRKLHSQNNCNCKWWPTHVLFHPL